jgi:hypothetical protein
MKRWPRRRLLVPVTIGLVLGLSGGALAAFAATTTDGPNRFIAAADWEAPHVTRTIVAKTPGYYGGRIGSNDQFYVYAQIDDGGNPPAGVGTVTTNVSNFNTGGATVTMNPGAFAVEGVPYNYRSTLRTSLNGMANGTRTYSITMSDVAVPVHTQTQTGFTVTIDNTTPAPVQWTAVNKPGGIAGRAEQGDIITYTWNEPIDPESLVPGWNGGSPITVTGRLSWGGGGNTRFRLRNAAGVTTLNFGTIYLQRNYLTATTMFPNTTITMLGNTVTVVLGTPTTPANLITVTVATTPQWTPNTAAYDAAGNPMSGTTITLPGGPRIFF